MNDRLAAHDPGSGYRLEHLRDPANSGSLLLVLTFSGGGTRAAALAYGVMEALAATEVQWEGKRKRLLDEVDIISSVSGGSYTAAYFALHREGLFTRFREDFLTRDVQSGLTRKILAPANLVRASSPLFGRVDLVSEYLDEHLFHGATFADLARQRKRPFLIINASDLSVGARFEFTQDQFDLLCSDLSSYKLSRAVAASSAVPVVFSPLTLRNYAGSCGYAHAPREAGGQESASTSGRRDLAAAELDSYLDVERRPFIHLLDGGLADNTGVRALLDRLLLQRQGPRRIAQELGSESLRRVVLVKVSAETPPDLSLDRIEAVPTIAQVIRNVKDIPINRYSFETTALFRAQFENWAQRAALQGGHDAPEFHLVEVSLGSIEDAAERERLMRIPTSLRLSAAEVDDLRAFGARALRSAPEFQRLLESLSPAAPAAGPPF
ncbi:MAG TPA: patatin-like phospholipase family protein [Ramlibacter sp.]